MKKSFLFLSYLVLSLLFTFSIFAQENNIKDSYHGPFINQHITQGHNIPLHYDGVLDLLYDNGPLVTHPGGGLGGADASALQTTLGMGTYGFGAQVSAGNSVADDFTISGSAWDIGEIDFFSYQTGSGPNPSINDVRVQIWDGPPNAGGAVIYGDLTTNVLYSASFTNIYRVLDTDLLNGDRPVMLVTVLLPTVLTLQPGTYWLHWQLGGSGSFSGPWVPPVTVLGSTGTGNALQYTSTGWAPIMDIGPQDMAFLISGPQAGPAVSSDPFPANGATNVDIDQDISWTNPAAATSIELFWGTSPGSLASIYSGAPITTFDQGTMDYFTTYYWRVDETDGTGTTTGPVWNFQTEHAPPPPGTLLSDPFDDMSNWTAIGPLGFSNWLISGTNYAGGISAPELEFSWSPSFVGASYFLSIPLTVTTGHNCELTFTNYVNFYATPCGPIGAAVTTDGGTTFTSIYETSPTGTYGPEVETVDFVGTDGMQVAFYYNGDSFNINFWYIDDALLVDLDFIPVELTSFTAAVNDGNVVLNWVTATEKNNQGFEVQRNSGNGYEVVGFVQGSGTSTQSHTYSYTDKVGEGNYTYRLRQVDFDGTSNYSNTVEVKVEIPKVYSLAQNYPNPFNPTTQINFSLASDSKVTLKVFDIIGQEVATLLNENIAAGNHSVTFDASKLNSGVYLYKIEARGADGSSFTSVKKMILTK